MARNLFRTPSGLNKGHQTITCCKTAILLLIMFCISGATIALTSPSVEADSLSKPALFTSKMPYKSRIEVAAIVADQVKYTQALDVVMTVTNASDMPANNVHLFCRARPGGYFTVEVVGRPYVAQDINNIDISLDDFSPGSQKDIHMFIQAPPPGQILGEWSHNFNFNFMITHDVTPESLAGTITFITRHGKILVQTSGFAQ